MRDEKATGMQTRRDPEAIAFSRSQRAMTNEFASLVWQMVRNRGCRGEKFRREYSIGPYTVDFCCVALKLIVEVDGAHHFTEEGRMHDRARDHYLRQLGYVVWRIPEYDVLRDARSAGEQIEEAIDKRRAE